MEASKNQLFFVDNAEGVHSFKSNSKAYINGVKQFTNKIQNEKQNILDNSLKEKKFLLNELENLKLQNEELEMTIQEMNKEKENLENSFENLKKSFANLSQKYNEARDLMLTSHNQNLQLSDVIDKLRQNEKCLIGEFQKMRRLGLPGTDPDLQTTANNTTIENLEKEVKYWQQETDKLNKIISLQDQASQITNQEMLRTKKNNQKHPNHMKRYNKMIVRSHSMENSQKKLKENELFKMKIEKEQLKRLLENLEFQIAEIQNNIYKISNEKQKFKDLYFEKKEIADKSESIIETLKSQVKDATNENARIKVENEKYSENINILIKDNKYQKLLNQKLQQEVQDLKSQFSLEMKNTEVKMGELVQENHDLAIRSCNLKDKLQTIESEILELEQELKTKGHQLKEQTDFSNNLKILLDKVQKDLLKKSEELNCLNENYSECLEDNEKLKSNEETLQRNLEININQYNTMQLKIKENDEEIEKVKTSYKAQIIKFENHLQKAEEMITSKIKLISSLELKLANYCQEVKVKDDEILQVKRQLDLRNHEFDILLHKYEESQDAKQYLQQHINNIITNNNKNNHEIVFLNQSMCELNMLLEKLKNENISQKKIIEQKDQCVISLDESKREIEKNLSAKEIEITKNKRVIAQLLDDIDQKELRLQSLEDAINEKDRRLSNFQALEHDDSLNEYDDSVIQTTARMTGLEKENQNLRDANARLSRQKDQISFMLSKRNKEIGQLQAKLDNLDDISVKNAHSSFRDSMMDPDSLKRRERDLYY